MNIEFANQNSSVQAESGNYRQLELEQLVREVASRQGGQGDYTKEKYERPQESIEEVCTKIKTWLAKRREESL